MIAAPPVPLLSDQLAHHATAAIVAAHLPSTRPLFAVACHRERRTVLACTWVYGGHGAPLIGDATGTIRTLPALAGGAPRYQIDYTGTLARGHVGAYRARSFHWRYTSPSHAALLKRLTRHFTSTAGDAFTAWENRTSATGTPNPTSAPCSWALNDDGRISGACTATYTANTAGATARDCQVTAAGNWAFGHWTGVGLDTSDCGTPG